MDSQLGCWQAWEFPSSSGALNRTKGFSWKLGFQRGRKGQRRAKGQELLPGAFAPRGARVSTLGPASLNRVSCGSRENGETPQVYTPRNGLLCGWSNPQGQCHLVAKKPRYHESWGGEKNPRVPEGSTKTEMAKTCLIIS